MASIVARRTTRTIQTGVGPINFQRRIHLNGPAQEGWFGSFLRGSKSPESAESSQSKATETTKPDPLQKPTASTQGALLDSVSVTAEAQTPPLSGSLLVKPKKKTKRTPLSSKVKALRFEDNISFIVPRLGRKPQLKLPKIRKVTWVRTIAVCQTGEELRKVMELTPSWRDMGNQFDETFSEAFILRCITLKMPDIALDLFGNYAKYHVPLSLKGARDLINATYDTQPLSFIIAVTSLFDVYKLPPVAQDLPCCAMVISACLKDGSPDALVVAQALVPHLKKVLDKVGPQPIPRAQKGDDMSKVWARWALKKVDEMTFKLEGKREDWLRDWRLKSGHIADASQL